MLWLGVEMARPKLYSSPIASYRLEAGSISSYFLFTSLLVDMYCSTKQAVIFYFTGNGVGGLQMGVIAWSPFLGEEMENVAVLIPSV